jgi:hypothetical protein
MNFDKNELFFEPKTNQYGSHMVMTNVTKTTKTKYLNIDTRFRDEYNYNDGSYFNITTPDKYKYNITIPEIVTNVKTISIKCIELPMTFYNVSSNLENNYFTVTASNGNAAVITIPDGSYNSLNSVVGNVNRVLSSTITDLSLNTDMSGNYYMNSNSHGYTIDFSSFKDKYNFKSSLGWLIGFRLPTYVLPSSGGRITAECSNQLSVPAPRYLYLAIDEFNKGVQTSFVTPVSNAFLNKNVIARITLNSAVYGYGSVLPANMFNGYLVSDVRSYNGKVNLQKLNIQLLNESGMPVDLNGQDFSFCIEVTYE